MEIVIVACNEAEYVKLSVESIRMFADVEDLTVTVVDNGSADGLGDWAKEQPDITYVYMDEGRTPFGKVINQVRAVLQLKGDMLVMRACLALTPQCLSGMLKTLHESADTGAVGPVSNGLINYQKMEGFADYEDAVNGILQTEEVPDKTVLGLYYGAVLFRKEMLEQLGAFDEELVSAAYVIKDYCLRMIEKNWLIKVNRNSFLWCFCDNAYERNANTYEDSVLKKKWGMNYFNTRPNSRLVEMLQEDRSCPLHVLEIGCDCGATLLEIQERYPNAVTYGTEINVNAAQIASHVSNVTLNNIEEENLPYEPETLDYIIFGDVLEHLHDPLRTIKYCRGFLRSGGCVIASIPNVMHISVMRGLLDGNFTYMDEGLLDRTHIHLFTFNEIVRMFQAGGFRIKNMESVGLPIGKENHLLIDKLLGCGGKASRQMYETFQYVVCAQKQE
ncbi:MAG: bifunctional glycosyltransferase/class I SAM-dependent methyltransferase [Lachnospiraceae bacterium]|nr:bifunctional glycosyltransferase/class I SAM-dependent methyltransferase [Lachnospiraceae bacterium]